MHPELCVQTAPLMRATPSFDEGITYNAKVAAELKCPYNAYYTASTDRTQDITHFLTFGLGLCTMLLALKIWKLKEETKLNHA
eukprot:3680798-Amphidinium_carterae.1